MKGQRRIQPEEECATVRGHLYTRQLLLDRPSGSLLQHSWRCFVHIGRHCKGKNDVNFDRSKLGTTKGEGEWLGGSLTVWQRAAIGVYLHMRDLRLPVKRSNPLGYHSRWASLSPKTIVHKQSGRLRLYVDINKIATAGSKRFGSCAPVPWLLTVDVMHELHGERQQTFRYIQDVRKHRAWFLSGAHAARPRSLRRTKGCCSSESLVLFAVLLSSSAPKTRPEEDIRKPLLSFALQTTPAALNASQPRRRQGSLKLPNGARTAARLCMCMCVHMHAGRAPWCKSVLFHFFPNFSRCAHNRPPC